MPQILTFTDCKVIGRVEVGVGVGDEVGDEVGVLYAVISRISAPGSTARTSASPTSRFAAPARLRRRASSGVRTPLSATPRTPAGSLGRIRSEVARSTAKEWRSRLFTPT